MKEIIVLKKISGEIIRLYSSDKSVAYVSFNKKTGRIDLHSSQQTSEDSLNLGVLNKKELKNNPKTFLNIEFSILEDASQERVKLAVPFNPIVRENKIFFKASSVFFFFLLFFMSYFMMTDQKVEKKAEIKKEVIIVKKNTIKLRHSVLIVPQSVSPVTRKRSVRRLGALAILGSLKSGKQVGGLNLKFNKASAGIGLGGDQGSGGVQTSLYAKGLSKAALGVGGNIKGAGGYGKVGAGGGSAGTGRLSLVGSRGVSSLTISRESIESGGLDKAAIAAVIQAHLSEVRFCYEKALQGQPDLKGRVLVSFSIQASGLIKVAGIKHSSLNFPSVEFCIVKHLKLWKFPKPKGGVTVKVSYPFVLQRSN